MKVALDSSVLLLLAAEGVPVADEAQRMATRRLTSLVARLLVPMLALGEVLVAFPSDLRADVVEGLRRSRRLLSYDAKATWWTAQMGPPRAGRGQSRQQIKWDAAIAACCVRHRIDVLCALDGDFVSLFERAGSTVAVRSPIELLEL